jgi:Tfp pilus assembly protein PilF
LPVWAWLLIAVLVLGAAVRIANLAATSSSPFFTRPVIDGQVYDEWAMAIRNGKAPAEPFYQDPLYPYFLAVIYGIFGHRYLAVYIIQLLLGTALLWLTFDTTRMVFDRRAGIIAALLAAFNKPLIFYEGQVEKTALAVFLVGLFIWVFARAMNSRRLIWQFLCGLALGLAALTRANLLIFAPLLPLLFLFLRRQSGGPRLVFTWNPKQLAPALAALTGIAIIIAPVVIRNTILARELTLTTTQSGQNFFIGNSEYNRTGQYVAPPWVRPNPEFEQTDFRDYADKAAGHKLSSSQVSSFYTGAALKAIAGSPGRAVSLFARKLMLYFNDYEVPDNQDMYFFGRYSWVLRIPLCGFGIVFALGLAGILLLRQRPVPRVSLIVFFFGYGLSVIAFYVFSRYRLPSLPALLPFAGGMAVWLWNSHAPIPSPLRHDEHNVSRRKDSDSHRVVVSSWLNRLRSVRFWGGLLMVGAAFAVTRYPLHRGSGKWEAAQCLVNLGSSYFHEGDTVLAIATFNEALRENPDHGEALRNLGIIQLGQNRLDSASELLAHAIRAEPANPVSHHFLGKVRERQGELDSAYVQYQQAVNLAPGRVEYRFALAPIIQKLGDLNAALAQYDTMETLAPDNPLVRHNRSVALYLLGRISEAWQEFETAKRLGGAANPQFEQVLRSALNQPRQ